MRGFASYWTDRPLFRIMCGLMPESIWASAFGRDREGLIGHKIDAKKLGKKIPENLAKLDMQLSMLEPLFAGGEGEEGRGSWVFGTATPSLADVSVFYEMKWGYDIASGRLTEDITAKEMKDGELEGMGPVFNAERYPGVWNWYKSMERYFENLPSTEEVSENFAGEVEQRMTEAPLMGAKSLLLPTPRSSLVELDAKCGLTEGALVSVAPADTGKDE